MLIRITEPVVMLGNIQLLRGQELDVTEEVCLELVGERKAILVPMAEQATRPAPETAVMPRNFGKPKPPTKPKGR